ncbi:MAG: GNAT family N-acetyltransferase [Victivallaceae bacterium]|nr:GNAT family N-acetyltransferase [Victivallaceae bacterium]
MNIVIRPFADADAPGVAEIMYASFKTYLGDLLQKKETPDEWRENLRPLNGDLIRRAFVAADEKNTVLGCIECVIDTRYRLGTLNRIGVSPDAAGKGIGRMLFEAALDFWQEHNARKVYTDVSSINPGAKKFYERMGFVAEGILKSHFFDGVDEYQLSLFLQPPATK